MALQVSYYRSHGGIKDSNVIDHFKERQDMTEISTNNVDHNMSKKVLQNSNGGDIEYPVREGQLLSSSSDEVDAPDAKPSDTTMVNMMR